LLLRINILRRAPSIRAWDLIDKTRRTPNEERLMVASCLASIYHWSERPDCSDPNLSVGYWQASRVYAVLGNAAEALARAEALTGSQAKVSEYITLARELAAQVTEKDDRDSLLKDLDSI
jgi:hypothetical protein